MPRPATLRMVDVARDAEPATLRVSDAESTTLRIASKALKLGSASAMSGQRCRVSECRVSDVGSAMSGWRCRVGDVGSDGAQQSRRVSAAARATELDIECSAGM
jgi:hypothetical protein